MRVNIFASPYDTGRRDHRMGRGPARLLERGVEGMFTARGHDVTTQWMEVPESPAGDVRHAFDLYAELAKRVRAARAFPLVLAGNCGVTLGAVSGLGREGTAVVWFDAHGDFNTPDTSPTGFLDGMVLAALAGRCWHALAARIPGFAPLPESQIVLVGARDLDPPEAKALADCGVRRVAADLAGLDTALGPPVRRAYLHVDLDVLDPSEGKANQFAAPGGLTVPVLQDAIRRVAARVPIAGAAMTAYDPAQDPDDRIATAALAVCDTIAETLA